MGISREQALDCFASDDLIGVGMEADAIRRRLHPEGVVSYLIDGTIVMGENPGMNAEPIDTDPIFTQIRETVDAGGTGVRIHIGGHPETELQLEIAGFERLFAAIKRRFPTLWLHGLSADVILSLATHAGLSLEDTLRRLHEAGLDSLAGDEAGILDDAVRQRLTSGTCTSSEWIAVHRAAHRLGLRTTASLSFGGGETAEQRVRHLEMLRALQEETGGFTAFVPCSVLPDRAWPALRPEEQPTSVEFLKTLAISRMVLDNIENVQSNWAAEGLKVAQMGLRFGGNDVGSIGHESSGGPATEEELRRLIRDAGFKPVQRDTRYGTMFMS